MTAWITRLIVQGGAGGVFLLMLLENVVPPIPSELIMPLAGFVSAQGRMSGPGAILAGTAGSVLGAWLWYELGRRLGRERLGRWVEAHGRWLAITPQEYRRADGWFRRWGLWALLIGRCLPGVRGVICIPAGVTGMSRPAFALFCTAGSLLWCVLLVEAGRFLGTRYRQVEVWLSPIAGVFLLLCLTAYAVRVLRFSKRRTDME